MNRLNKRGAPGILTLTLISVLMLGTACSSESDPVDDVLGGLPNDTASVAVLDVEAMTSEYEIDPGTLGHFTDLVRTVAESGDSSTPERLLTGELAAVVPPLGLPFDNGHQDAIDIGSIEAVVSTSYDGLIIIRTSQDPDELASSYPDAGFEPQDDDRYLHPDDGTQEGSGGFPAVRIDDGTLLLGRSLDVIDQFGTGDGVSAPMRTLLDAADDAWAISVHADHEMEPGTCGAGQGVARIGTESEFMVLGGGANVVPPESRQLSSSELGPAELDDEVSRYPIEPADADGHQPLLSAAQEIPSLAEC